MKRIPIAALVLALAAAALAQGSGTEIVKMLYGQFRCKTAGPDTPLADHQRLFCIASDDDLRVYDSGGTSRRLLREGLEIITSAELAADSVGSSEIANNAVGATELGIGTTAGDVIYYDGTDWLRLGIGTPGQVLEVNPGATAPEWDTDDSGAGAANSFETQDVPSGTDPVAESAADTLFWTSTGSTVTLTGDSGTDTINVEAIDVTCANCLTGTEITGLDAGDVTTGTMADARIDGAAEENEIDLLDLQDGAVDNCAGDEVVKRNAGDTAFECAAGGAGGGLSYAQVAASVMAGF